MLPGVQPPTDHGGDVVNDLDRQISETVWHRTGGRARTTWAPPIAVGPAGSAPHISVVPGCNAAAGATTDQHPTDMERST